MKFTPLAAVFAVFAAFCAFAPAPASAQGVDNAYAVAGVYVDETAANSAAAQQAGFASAQRIGFARLVRRITLPQELAANPPPLPDDATLDTLTLSTDIEEAHRSTTRYVGRLTVRFNADAVKALLRQQNLTVIDTRTAPALVAPLVATGTADDVTAMWREVWTNGGFQDDLVPLRIAPDTLQGAPSWQTAAPFAQAAAAASTLYATLSISGTTATARLVEVSQTAARDRGAISAQINGADPTAAQRAALASLAQQASEQLQTDWKSRMAVNGSQRAQVSASALYNDEHQWETIKQGLQAAAATLISEIHIEAVGRSGALVSFSFVGDRAQLAAELARHNVSLSDSATGPVLRATAAASNGQ